MATQRPAFAKAQLPLSLILVAAISIGCSVEASSDGPTPANDNAAQTDETAVRLREAPRVRVEPVVRREMQRVLETTGAVESMSELDIVAEATGRVIELLVEEGDIVQKGDLLARIESADQELALADAAVALAEAGAALERSALAEMEASTRIRTAELQLEQAEQDHARNLQLTNGEKVNALSAQALEAGRIARDSASENLAQVRLAELKSKLDTKSAKSAEERALLAQKRAKRALERCDLRAPIQGVISARAAELGGNLAAGVMAFHITAPDRLRVVFFRPQRELDLFLGSTTITLSSTAEALPGFTFEGQILRTSPTIDRASGAFRVTAKLNPSSLPNEAGETGRLLPGMLLRLYIVTGRHVDTLVVPKRSVRREGSDVFVLVAQDGAVRRVGVTEGFTDENHVEVTPIEGASLATGELVVTVGSRELQQGDEVKVDDETVEDEA
ncbi:MAG: membrane fusion protein (multidrug efflux system) [Bacteroidia bacterium]|jgi:membrane fusion protein (multidrug efflux system)